MQGRRQKYDSVAFELGSSSKAWSVYTVRVQNKVGLGLRVETGEGVDRGVTDDTVVAPTF